MDGERRAAYAPGLTLFIGSWARLPRSLRGEPGVGKTGIVEGFAQLLAEGKLPEALGRPAVRRVDIPVRRANGWRKKSGLRRRPFAFHWHVGETTTLLEAGSASGSMDAANILKPALARGAIRVICQRKSTAWRS